ncbi:MAG: hypothetical protein WBX01_12845 [Nitrososphaeraceae archaeon]
MSDICVRIEDRMACIIMQDIHSASFHLEHHVTKDGTIIELDSKCEYCQVYIEEQRIPL